MTPENVAVAYCQRYRRARIAEKLVAKVYGGKRQPHLAPFDVVTDNLAIEVKSFKKTKRMKVHIECDAWKRKMQYLENTGLQPLLAVVVFDGRAKTLLVGELQRHCRPSALDEVSISQYI